MSQSQKPTSRSPSTTALYGAASWWPTINPGRIVPPMNQRSPAGGSKSAVRSWTRRSHWPTWVSIESADAQRGPRLPAADRLARQIGEHLAALVVEAERAGSAIESGILQMPQQRVHRRRPWRGPLVDDITDQHGAGGVTAGQPHFAHSTVCTGR